MFLNVEAFCDKNLLELKTSVEGNCISVAFFIMGLYLQRKHSLNKADRANFYKGNPSPDESF